MQVLLCLLESCHSLQIQSATDPSNSSEVNNPECTSCRHIVANMFSFSCLQFWNSVILWLPEWCSVLWSVLFFAKGIFKVCVCYFDKIWLYFLCLKLDLTVFLGICFEAWCAWTSEKEAQREGRQAFIYTWSWVKARLQRRVGKNHVWSNH